MLPFATTAAAGRPMSATSATTGTVPFHTVLQESVARPSAINKYHPDQAYLSNGGRLAWPHYWPLMVVATSLHMDPFVTMHASLA